MNEDCLLIRTGVLSCIFRQKSVIFYVFYCLALYLNGSSAMSLMLLHSDTEQLGVSKSLINVLLKSSLKTQWLQHIFWS